MLISCKIPKDNPELGNTVKEVQKHNHTKSCLKRNGICRYGFPDYPAKKQLYIAKPLLFSFYYKTISFIKDR